MKAAVYYGPGDLRIEESPLPEIGPGDILLKVGACAICGTDMRIFRHGHRGVKIPKLLVMRLPVLSLKLGKT